MSLLAMSLQPKMSMQIKLVGSSLTRMQNGLCLITFFQKICVLFGKPDIDLFANRLHHKLPRYCSWHPDPGAEHVDAFTLEWGQSRFSSVYIFCPFSLVPRITQKILNTVEKVVATMVVPYWPAQAWYPLLMQHLVAPPALIQTKHNTLFLPHKPQAVHPLVPKLQLLAIQVSKSSSMINNFLSQWSGSCWTPAASPLINSIRFTGKSGRNIWSNGVQIPIISPWDSV